MQDEKDLIESIQTIFSEKLMVSVDSPDRDLFEAGILDSMSLLELLLQVEERFGLRVSVAELEMEDIQSVRKIAQLVAREVGAASS